MSNKNNFIELVKQAQLGDEKSLNRLAKLSRERLRIYVYRLTLADDVTQDIVQESMLEMFKFLDKLERADRFWPWLRRIATNKIHHRYKRERHGKTVSASEVGYRGVQKDGQEGLASLVSEELKQTVAAAMRQLKPRHREVLVLRCYEELAYSEIAEQMQCSEFAVRMLFCRAKRSLAKQLSRRGLGKGALLTALALFGKMTAPSEAAAAKVSITAATTRVGVAAGLVGMAASKAVVVSLATAGVLAVGTTMMTSEPEKTTAVTGEKPVESYVTRPASHTSEGIEECWYYFPESANGPVMMRLMKSNSKGKQSYCAWRQNAQGNYHFDRQKNTVSIENYRMWRSDLTVQRLPTDKAKLRQFLTKVEGGIEEMGYIPGYGDGLLVIVKRGGNKNSNPSRITYHYNLLDEEYFRYDWPAGIKVVDNRDPMHKRGWTYFRVTGRVDGKEVSGTGRIPFVYAAGERYYPWLRLQVADRQIIDAGDGRLFKGLSRPWMGLHTIDTVRRDAAESQIRFETRYMPGSGKAEVVLSTEQGKIIYTIDMETDVIDKIAFSTSNGREGELRFSYLQEISGVDDDFAEPRKVRDYKKAQQKNAGMLWLLEIVDNR